MPADAESKPGKGRRGTVRRRPNSEDLSRTRELRELIAGNNVLSDVIAKHLLTIPRDELERYHNRTGHLQDGQSFGVGLKNNGRHATLEDLRAAANPDDTLEIEVGSYREGFTIETMESVHNHRLIQYRVSTSLAPDSVYDMPIPELQGTISPYNQLFRIDDPRHQVLRGYNGLLKEIAAALNISPDAKRTNL